MSQLIDLIARQAEHKPDAIALASGLDRMTYGMLPFAIAAKAARINAIDPSSRPVGIDLDNDAQWVLTDLALRQLGRVTVPLPSFYLPAQKMAALRNAGATSVIERSGARRLRNEAVALPPRTATISDPSVSTDRPKVICFSDEQLYRAAHAIVDRFRPEAAGRHLALLPLGLLLEYVAGLYATLIAGGEYRMLPAEGAGLADPLRPDFERMAAAIANGGATRLILVPALLRGLVHTLEQGGRRLPSLTLVAVGGAGLPDSLIERSRAVGLPLVQGYRLTECGAVIALEQTDAAPIRAVGVPLGHGDVDISAGGEACGEGNRQLGALYCQTPARPFASGAIGYSADEGWL